MDDLVDALANNKVHSGLYLRFGYWKVRMAEERIENTAFIMQQGQWEWLILPMGLSNAPSTFYKVVANLFNNVRSFIESYLDDVIIYSALEDEYL